MDYVDIIEFCVIIIIFVIGVSVAIVIVYEGSGYQEIIREKGNCYDRHNNLINGVTCVEKIGCSTRPIFIQRCSEVEK